MIDQLPEKVLSLGDLVSLSFRNFRQNFSIYRSALLLPALGAALGADGAFFAFNHWVTIASKSMLALGPFALHMGLVLVGIVLWFMSIWKLLLRASAIIRCVLGFDRTYEDGYSAVKARSKSIFLAYNLILIPPLISLLLWTFVAFLLISLIPSQDPLRLIVGSLGFGFIGFGLTVSISLSSLFGSLLVAISACEDGTISQSLSRAAFFFKTRLLRGGSFICLMTMSLILVYIACFSPIFLLAIIESYSHADLGLASKSVVVQFLEAMLDTAFNVISFGIGFTGYGLFYRDLRLRLEGQDLINKIDRLSQQ